MASKVTVTGKIGPGLSLTTQVYNGVSSFTIDCVNQVLHINQGGTIMPAVDIAADATLTVTVASGNYTVSISA